MIKLFKPIILIFFIVFQGWIPKIYSQENKTGIYLMKNYSRNEYNAHEQNWASVRGHNGAMYFANNQNGVLEYDGSTWTSIPIANNSIVRSLAVDSSGTIFVGAFDEFGFLAPNETGRLTYHSLSQDLDSSYRNFKNIWGTYCIDDEVVFYSQTYIFKYKNFELQKIIPFPKGNFLGFKFDKQIYIGNYNIGILNYDWENNKVDTLAGSEIYAGFDKDIFVMLPFNKDEYLIVSSTVAEMSIFDVNKHSRREFGNEYLNQVIKTDFIYQGVKIRDNIYLATITNDAGVFSINNNGEITSRINDKLGLQENQVTNLYSYNGQQGQHPLWMTTVNGISKALTNSPIRKFGQEIGLTGINMDIIEFNGKKYVATFTGVYILDAKDNNINLQKVQDLNRPCWDLEVFEVDNYSTLIVSSDDGLYRIDKNGKVTSFIDHEGKPYKPICYKSKQSFFDKNKLNVSNDYGYAFFTYNNGVWKKISGQAKIKEAFKTFAEIDSADYLFCTEFKGIWDIREEKDIKQLDKSVGLPTMDYNKVYQFTEGEVLIGTQNGVYQYDNKNSKFEPIKKILHDYADTAIIIDLIYKDHFGNYWFNIIDDEKSNHLEKAIPLENGEYQIVKTPFRLLPNMSIQNIFTDKNNITWICGSNGLFTFDNNFKKDYDLEFKSIIRTVTIGEDSVIFNGSYFDIEKDKYRVVEQQTDNFKPILKYKDNNIKFTYAAPFFENEEAIVYSHFLEGNDNDWSKWHSENFSIYTNLGERKNYTFHVKAKNIYGKESYVATYNFRVLPPWQRTIWAFVAYAILSILIIYFIVKLNARRLIKEKERLEQIVRERTKEIRHQKEEIETQRDEIIAQRDTLEVLNKEIEKKNENITASIRYAERIQKAILPSEDYIKSLLPDSFVLFKPKDIVSGDFYFCDEHDGIVVFTAVDCTGHGVPGAFVSIVGSNWLTRALNEENLTKPSDIINYLSDGVYKTLQKDDDSKVKDGMDLSLVALDLKNMKGAWAGAYNPLYLYRKGEVIQFKADVFPVGTPFNERFNGYTNHEFDLEEGDGLYVFSDGYIDQFGGPNRKKFMKKRFRELIGTLQEKPMEEQKQILDQRIEEWKKEGKSDQIDDILVFGVKI